MPEYKVAKISEQPPREWAGPNGTVYYLKVMLEGHGRPVSIGKKSPDALKVGDTVYGTINPDPSHDEDKFKAEAKPFGGSGGFSGGSNKPAYHDNSDGQRQGMCFNNAANYVNLLTTIAKTPLSEDEWASEVHKYANALYKLGDLGKVVASTEPRVDYDPEFGPPNTPQQDEISLSDIPF